MTVVSKKILEEKPAQTNVQTKQKMPNLLKMASGLFIFFLSVFAVYFTFLNTSDSNLFQEIAEKLAKNYPLSAAEEAFFCEYLNVSAGSQDCQETLAAYQKKMALWSESDINEKIILLKNLPFLSEEDKILLQELEVEPDKKGVDVNFEDTEKLCKELEIDDIKEYHNIAKFRLKKRFSKLLNKKFRIEERNNPDFGITKRGFIVIRSVKSKKTLHTGEKP
jgi:hypothetical protein